MIVRPRIIPVLLIENRRLIKTIKFKHPTYIGDPINAIKIFNEKEVDELLLIDRSKSISKQEPDYELLKSIASEAFMPLAYGGGINNVNQVKKILSIGFEKVVLNTSIINNEKLITEISELFGSQSIVVSIDVKKSIFGYYLLCFKSGMIKRKYNIVSFCKKMEELGAGEIFINSIDRDGTMLGYDLQLVKSISQSVNIPIIACGGASNIDDLYKVLNLGGASAAAASSMFIYYGRNKGVLITFPEEKKLFEKGIYKNERI